MNVKEILIEWLKAHGYEGLMDEWRECGCEIDELFPCSCDGIKNCEPGYKVACTPDCDHGWDYEEGAWHIQSEKPGEVK